jgi:hypothetical protein
MLPFAAFLLCGLASAVDAKDARVEITKAQLNLLDKAIEVYRLKNGEFPKKLKLLVDASLVEAKAILDPWGKEFEYEPAGKRNAGKKPDIWAVGPDKKMIGNWPEEKK